MCWLLAAGINGGGHKVLVVVAVVLALSWLRDIRLLLSLQRKAIREILNRPLGFNILNRPVDFNSTSQTCTESEALDRLAAATQPGEPDAKRMVCLVLVVVVVSALVLSYDAFNLIAYISAASSGFQVESHI